MRLRKEIACHIIIILAVIIITRLISLCRRKKTYVKKKTLPTRSHVNRASTVIIIAPRLSFDNYLLSERITVARRQSLNIVLLNVTMSQIYLVYLLAL